MDVFAMKCQSDRTNFDAHCFSALKSSTLHRIMPYFSALKASIFFTRERTVVKRKICVIKWNLHIYYLTKRPFSILPEAELWRKLHYFLWKAIKQIFKVHTVVEQTVRGLHLVCFLLSTAWGGNALSDDCFCWFYHLINDQVPSSLFPSPQVMQ